MLVLAPFVLAAGCASHPGAAPVHTMALPDIPPPELPDGPGREMVIGACSTCHTLRYILDEPPLSRRQWAVEVHKMRRAYRAPFAEEMAGPIVDYLVAVHGD